MRRGEVLALRWCDVDLKRAEVHVTRNLTGRTTSELVVGTPKTQAGVRDVALPAYAVALLESERVRRQNDAAVLGGRLDPESYICCGAHGQPIVPDSLTKELARIRRTNKLPRIHAHLLRHAVATTMRESGERLEVVQEHLGHADPNITAGMYGFVRPEAKRAAAERYGALWGDGAKGPENDPSGDSGHQMDTKSSPLDELAARRARKEPA